MVRRLFLLTFFLFLLSSFSFAHGGDGHSSGSESWWQTIDYRYVLLTVFVLCFFTSCILAFFKGGITSKVSMGIFGLLFLAYGWSLFSPLILPPNIMHIHGVMVDSHGSNKLYVATHHGLFSLVDDSDFSLVGSRVDDFMGFTVHPTEKDVLFASGHSSSNGQNLGLLMSMDGGESWSRLSEGQNGPVDFHSLAVSPIDPSLMYGWYARNLQRSEDGGFTWQIIDTRIPEVMHFAPSPFDANVLYASTVYGLMVSENKGADWKFISDSVSQTTSIALALSYDDKQTILSFTQRHGLAKSIDGGQSWETVDGGFFDDPVFYLTYHPEISDVAYLSTKSNAIYKSVDDGMNWEQVW